MIPPNEFIHLMFMGLGPTELIVILVIIMVLFGASKIPQLARGLGKGINEFKEGLKEGKTDEDKINEIEDKDKKKEAGD